MALESIISGNFNFKYLKFNYTDLINDIVSSSAPSENDYIQLWDSPPVPNSVISTGNINKFKKAVYFSPFEDISVNTLNITCSEKQAYEDLKSATIANIYNQAMPPFNSSIVNITGNANFQRSKFDYDLVINNIQIKFTSSGKTLTKQDIADLVNITSVISTNAQNALNDLNMTANDFIVAFYKLPVNNFYELGLYSDASAINNLFNASKNAAFTEPNSLSLALPSFDTISPNPPTVHWITTGTNQTAINIDLRDDSIRWEYSIDNASNWIDGTGDSFTIGDDATYLIDHVQVRSYDYVGNVSLSNKNPSNIKIDSIAPNAPNVTFHSIAKNTTPFNVTLDPDVNSWQYSFDSGANWVDGTGTFFTLNDNTYAINTIRVKCFDLVGNESNQTLNNNVVIIHSQPPDTPTITFPNNNKGNESTHINISYTDIDIVSWQYNIKNIGWVNGIGSFFTLDDDNYAIGDIKVKIIDNVGNESNNAINNSDLIIESTQPSDPIVSFPAKINNTFPINVSFIESNIVNWSYKVNKGSWVVGSGNNFSLNNDTYDPCSIKIKSLNEYGVESDDTTNLQSIIVNSTPPSQPNVSYPANNIGNNNYQFVVTFPETNIIKWYYSSNAGSSWFERTGNNFTLIDGNYAVGDIQVKTLNDFGTESSVKSNPSSIIINSIWDGAIHINNVTGSVFSKMKLHNINLFQFNFNNSVNIKNMIDNFSITGNGTNSINGNSTTDALLYDTWQHLFNVNIDSLDPSLQIIRDNDLSYSNGSSIITKDKIELTSSSSDMVITNNAFIHLNATNGKIFVYVDNDNINTFQLKFNSNVTVNSLNTDFTITSGSNSGGSTVVVGYANCQTSSLTKNTWQTIFEITSDLNNLVINDDEYNLFSNGIFSINNNKINFSK